MLTEARSDWRSRLADLLAARWTLGLVAVLVGIHVGIAFSGGPEYWQRCYREFGLDRTGIVAGKIWQLLSYGLLHGSGLHVGLNAVALLAVGSRLERIGGFTLWWRLLLGGLVAGGVMHLLAFGGEDRLLVGASGAIMAALLWLTGVSPGSRCWPLGLSGRSLGQGMLVASLLLLLLNPGLGIPAISKWGESLGAELEEFVFGVSHACHFGGALVGWIAARWTLRPRVTLAQLQAERRRREGVSS
jgi:membrane associated rhomboid family serine protease